MTQDVPCRRGDIFLFALLSACCVPGGIALAQTEDAADAVEEIVVTGSRIRRTTPDGPIPVVSYGREDLDLSGVNTLSDFSRYLPFSTETFSDAESVGRPEAGSSQINLRGIGFDSTLTLLNGRRIAPYGVGVDRRDFFVDINSIPFAAIERVEILKDGASAIYGADAVAGVVNIILRDDFNGLEAQARGLGSVDGDVAESDFSLLAGRQGERFGWMATASHFSRGDLAADEREFTRDADLTSRGGFNRRSFFSSPTTVLVPSTNQTLSDPECPVGDETNSLAIIVPGFVEFCRYNFQIGRTSIPETRRTSITAAVDYELSEAWTAFADVIWSDNWTRHGGSPTPLTGNSSLPTVSGNPVALASHPNNPFGVDVELGYRPLDAGERISTLASQSARAVVGLKAAVDDWTIDVAANWSESEVDTRRPNLIAYFPFQDAVFGLGGPNRDQYYNPFGRNPVNDPLVIEGFTGTGSTLSMTTEAVVDVTATGELFELPAGGVGFSAGYQYRRQELDEELNAFLAAGNVAGVEVLIPVTGERDIHSAFVEFGVPVTARLEAQLAVRYENYSDFGSTTNPKLALGWQVTDSMLLRGSYATSFRAPAFRELDLPTLESTQGFIDTPRCALTDDTFDCTFFPYRAATSGNPNLEPEEGRSTNLGFLWRPDFGTPLSLQVDWWEIEHDDRIVDIDGQTIINQFPIDNPFVIRDPPTAAEAAMGIPGRINSVTLSFFNADTVTVRGLDVDLRHTSRLLPVGELDVSLTYTYLQEWTFEQGFAEARANENFAGTVGFNGPLPRHRGIARLAWRQGIHQLGATANYAGAYRSSIDLVVDGRETDQPVNAGSWTSVDIQYAVLLEDMNDAELRIGCQNCFDRDPPRYNYNLLWEGIHDGRGAVAYVSWTQPLADFR